MNVLLIKSPGVFTDVFYNTVFGFDAVSGGEAAGHGYGRINDIAVAAGSFPLNDLYFVTGAYKTGTFHFKFNGSLINLCLLSKRTCHLIVTSSYFHIHENKKHVGFPYAGLNEKVLMQASL